VKHKSYVRNLTLSICAVVVAFFLVEIGLRVFSLFSIYNDNKLFTASPVSGLPRMTKANLDKGDFFTNSHHLRDTEIPLDKPPHTYRIAVVGNSVTIGHGIPQSLLFTELIEKDFEERFHNQPKIDVINAGQTSFNINHFELFTEEFVYQYQPDLIIYQFNWNDLAVLSRMDGRRFPDQIPERGFRRFMLRHSKICLIFYKLTSPGDFAEKLLGYYNNPIIVGGFYRDLFSWRKNVKSRGIPFATLIVPMAIEIQAMDKYPEIAKQFIRMKNDIVRKIQDAGIELFDVSSQFRENYLEHHEDLFMDQGHLSIKGHALIADLIEDYLAGFVPAYDSLSAD